MKTLQRILLVLIVGSSVALSGCNTIEGAGEDIEAAGEVIEEEAEEHG